MKIKYNRLLLKGDGGIRSIIVWAKALLSKNTQYELKKKNIFAGHPNVKAFFTHSGLLSTQEAVYHGKPIIGMPFYLDQFINADKCVRDGLGEKVNFLTLEKNNLTQTIKKVLTNPK